MSMEEMLKGALGDPVAAGVAAARAVQSRNDYVQSRVAELSELLQKLQSEDEDLDYDELEEEASELAEKLEIEFIYTRANGKRRVYTPEAFWEPSGGCSWVESAQYGYDYGWNVH